MWNFGRLPNAEIERDFVQNTTLAISYCYSSIRNFYATRKQQFRVIIANINRRSKHVMSTNDYVQIIILVSVRISSTIFPSLPHRRDFGTLARRDRELAVHRIRDCRLNCQQCCARRVPKNTRVTCVRTIAYRTHSVRRRKPNSRLQKHRKSADVKRRRRSENVFLFWESEQFRAVTFASERFRSAPRTHTWITCSLYLPTCIAIETIWWRARYGPAGFVNVRRNLYLRAYVIIHEHGNTGEDSVE